MMLQIEPGRSEKLERTGLGTSAKSSVRTHSSDDKLVHLDSRESWYEDLPQFGPSLEESDIAEHVVTACRRAFKVGFAWLISADPDGHLRSLASSPSELATDLRLATRWDSPLAGTIGQSISAGHPIVSWDVKAKPVLMGDSSLRAEGMNTAGVFPLVDVNSTFGVLVVYGKEGAFDAGRVRFFKVLAMQGAMALDKANAVADIKRSQVEMAAAFDETLAGWSRFQELRDRETSGHTERVAALTVNLAEKADVPEAEIADVRRGALLHDVGLMGVPDSILLKPGPLSMEEWSVMRRHPVHAFELLSPIDFLRPALDIPYSHHEFFDGRGYPRGLKGEEIPKASRVFSVVDVYDALTSDRPYRQAWVKDKALEYIRGQSGRQFDPDVVEIFLDDF